MRQRRRLLALRLALLTSLLGVAPARGEESASIGSSLDVERESAVTPESALLPPLQESPLSRGYPQRRVPSRALVKLDGFDEAAVRAARRSSEAGEKLQDALLDLEREHGLTLRLVRAMSFGWALYDVTRAGESARLDEDETLRAIGRLRESDGVRASDDRWMKALATPNDPGRSYTWHYDSIRAEDAWDITVGTSSQRVGVVDTGTVRDHEDLSAKAVAGYDFVSITDISADGDGRDADYEDPGDGADCGQGALPDSWHGSHVAGTILASTNNNRGIAGVSWEAKLVTGRALGRCGGASSDILEAVAWMSGYIIDGVPDIAASDVVEVVNLSLGQDEACSDIEDDYMSTILSQTDVVIVAAAGNAGNGVPVGAPANCPGVLSVGAHGPGASRPLAPYSNWSSDLDVIGPGGDQASSGVAEDGVLSACGEGSSCYAFQQGTSMASPHVAGAVALLRAANPTLSQDDVRDILRGTGEACSSCDGIPALRLDLAVSDAAQRAGGIGLGGDTGGDSGGSTGSDTGGSTGGDTGGDTGGIDTGGGGTTDSCDPRRGNWDCANNFGCLERGGEAIGVCVAGAEGQTKSGGLCYDDVDCASGLCDRGVCTVPCDDGCRDGYACDDEAIPGGLCRPESCAASEGGICGGGWHCTYSSYNRYVCAAEGEDVFAPKGCSSSRSTSGALPLIALLLFGATLLVRRRRA